MRLRVQEVNVRRAKPVPRLGWWLRLYLWACARLYDELAPQYDLVSWLVSLGQWRRWQMGVWREVRGQHILELGCGTGALLVAGTQRGLALVGVDRSPRMLAVAAKRASIARSHAKFIQGDGTVLPFGGDVFDGVIATFPAGYILRDETLVEARRVLRLGGRMVILGLWVELRAGWWAHLVPFFYGKPDDAVLARILHGVEGAGFAAHWVVQPHGLFHVGVLVADKLQRLDDA